MRQPGNHHFSGIHLHEAHTRTCRYTKALDSIKSLRKDRTADLKAEKERLESLAKEKGHADKLRTRITDLNAAITSKQDQYDVTKREYEELVKNNARFYESATKFRELYVKVENLQQKKEHYLQELSDTRETVQEIEGAVYVVHLCRDLIPFC